MFFSIKDNMHPLENEPDADFVAIVPIEQASDFKILNQYKAKIPLLFMDFQFSKIEIFTDFIYGFINIPEILMCEPTSISFIYNENHLIFIDKSGFVNNCFEKILKLHRTGMTSCGIVLCYVLDFIILKDLEKMNAIQQKLAVLERNILNENINNPLKEITGYRSSTMKLHHYYIQLAGIYGSLNDNTEKFFDYKSQNFFEILIRKVTLLSREAQQIWEYTSQIRDVYQQRLDVHQNSIMKILTIVTTIFMPLTLITGWYGMNFSYMPELHWRYGYTLIFLVSIAVVIILCILFKKKRWW